MSDVVRPPCAELIAVADILDRAVIIFVDACRQSGPYPGRWEAPIQAWAMSVVMVRNIEAVTTMGRYDEVLVTAAWSNARAAFETSIRIIWLLHPRERFEGEMRWLALLAERAEFHEYMAMNSTFGSESRQRHERLAEDLHSFKEAVISRVPDPYRPVTKLPSLRRMLQEIDIPQMYSLYREASQYLHAGMPATSHYLRNLGSAKELSDFTTTVDWILPLRLCWLSLRNASRIVIDRLWGSERCPDWESLSPEVDAAFHQLVTSAFDRE